MGSEMCIRDSYKADSLQASTVSQNAVKSGRVSVPVVSAELHVVGQLMVDDRLADKQSGVNLPPPLPLCSLPHVNGRVVPVGRSDARQWLTHFDRQIVAVTLSRPGESAASNATAPQLVSDYAISA